MRNFIKSLQAIINHKPHFNTLFIRPLAIIYLQDITKIVFPTKNTTHNAQHNSNQGHIWHENFNLDLTSTGNSPWLNVDHKLLLFWVTTTTTIWRKFTTNLWCCFTIEVYLKWSETDFYFSIDRECVVKNIFVKCDLLDSWCALVEVNKLLL